MIDGHVHLEYGPLDESYVMEFIKVASEKGIDKIQILDHTHRFIEFAPMYEPLKKIPQQKEWLAKKQLDSLDTYMQLIQRMKSMNLPIEVTFGLEVCYTPQNEIFIKEVLKPYSFDFLVGAIHSIDGLLYDMNFSKEILWNRFNADYIYQRYYELVFALIKSDLFTQLAHPDTIKLFNIFPSYDLTATYHKMAALLNEHHMLAENNTGCHYRYQTSDIGLSDELLCILKEHHVALICASDAHHPKHVGMHCKEIEKKLYK